MRVGALEKIVEEMGIEGFTVADARQKLKSLRNTYVYNQQLQKTEKSWKSNYWFLQLNIRTVAQEPSQVQQFLNEKYGHEKNSSCLRDDAPATGKETVLVRVDTYFPTCLGKSKARLVTCTSNWYK